ncbi:S-adenosyl-L-methionine-dependent methyltransferase [Gautieria morchelliformis]|nr:S-adenosyl-L-methionine-dependent methyltransferase [Gautieria morchelliformis]
MSSHVARRIFSSPFLKSNGRHARCVHTTVNADEIARFSKLSSQWWDEQGACRMLHRMNPVRMQYVLEKLREVQQDEDEASTRCGQHARALSGLDVLDVGCGGGLMSESLARLGARTLGIDASASNIAIASLHASADPLLSGKDGSRLYYRHATSEDLVQEPERFDVVCSMEVLEHVDNPAAFLRSCCDLVKPGGHIFLSTIARTPLAYFLTIFVAEKAMGLVPHGTHTYDKFVDSSELVAFFRDEMQWFDGTPGRLEAELRGVIYLPWEGQWILCERGQFGTTECNYMFWARKPPS